MEKIYFLRESTNAFSKQWVYYIHSLICLPQGIEDQNTGYFEG